MKSDRKPKEHNCLNCETAKKPGWKGNCGTCPPLEDSGVRARVREDASRALLTDAIKEVDRLRAEVERLTKERDKWHDSWKDFHSERQELRGILRMPIPKGEGTVTQEFGPQYPLAEAARMIVADIESWKEKYERQCEGTKARMEENQRLGAEVARLTEISIHGCDCSQADACQFARERDEARAENEKMKAEAKDHKTVAVMLSTENERLQEENAKLRADFPPAPPLPVQDCKCYACEYLRRKQKEDWDKREKK